jgi:hypothetical protein
MQTEREVYPAYFGIPNATVRVPGELAPAPAPIEIKYQIFNHTGVEITAAFRVGPPSTVLPDYQHSHAYVIIRVEYVYSSALKENVSSILNRASENTLTHLNVLKEAYEAGKSRYWASGSSISVDYLVSESEILNHGGDLYHHESDVYLSTRGIGNIPSHPYSAEGLRRHRIASNSFVKKDGSFGYHVEIVDNAGIHGKFFINVNNVVWDITPKKSSLRKDGIYITTNHRSVGGRQLSGIEVKEEPIDILRAKELGLFTTYSDALTMGDLGAANKREILEIEHVNKKLASELATQKLTHDKEIQIQSARLADKERAYKEQDLSREARMRELEEMNNRLEHRMTMERLEAKERYEAASNARKDTGEILKLIVPVATGIVTIIGLTRPWWNKK